MSSKIDTTHSFVDLFISITLIFILLLVATLHQLTVGSKNTKNDLKIELTKDLLSQGVSLVDDEKDPFSEIIRLDEDKLKFDLNKADLKPAGVKLIDGIFGVVTTVLSEEKYKDKIESMMVEGHTDANGDGTTRGDLRNVQLSQQRALAVMNEAFFSLDKDAEKKKCLRALVAATGRGSSELLNTKDPLASENRRVEIKIKIKPDKELLKTLK